MEKQVTLKSIILGKKNKNGRTWKIRSFNKAAKELLGRKEKRPIFGMVGHPDSFDSDLKEVTHFIKNIEVKRNRVYVTIEFVEVNDKKRKSMIEEIQNNIKDFRLSPRAIGNIARDKTTVKLEKLLTFDIIHIKDFAYNG